MTEENFGAGAAGLSSAAAALLGWRPDEFWRSTPAELALALAPPGGATEAADREKLEELRKLFPDD